jgi:hypothetical protein
MGTREQNEKKFGNWQNTFGGGRVYWIDVPGRHGWVARYVKEVDLEERTLRFFQEIRDEAGQLVEIHQKYPEATGHRRIEDAS